MSTEELAVIESKALSIATEAHAGQVDKAGCDYIEHPKAVADRCPNRECRIVALLHDTIEDTFVTADFSHNMDLSRLPQITPKAMRRQMKYRVSYRFLAAVAY